MTQDIADLLRGSVYKLERIVTLGPDSAAVSRRILSAIEAEGHTIRDGIALLNGPGIDDSLQAARISSLLAGD